LFAELKRRKVLCTTDGAVCGSDIPECQPMFAAGYRRAEFIVIVILVLRLSS
jgi:hypothetical protein